MSLLQALSEEDTETERAAAMMAETAAAGGKDPASTGAQPKWLRNDSWHTHDNNTNIGTELNRADGKGEKRTWWFGQGRR